MGPAKAALAFQGVTKRYGDLLALDRVEFEIAPGEYFGLLGPNGAGKSTLIGVAAGLVKATGGRVAVMGHDVVRDYRRSRSALGVVPQELVYDPFFSVHELLRIQSGYFGFGKANQVWIDELLETLNLSDKADKNLHSLSGGMKRRVLIAQALVHRPDVLILDEPTAGVDVELRQALWHFTRRLHDEGHTIVLTTHYLEEAEALCDRIGILAHGRLAALDDKQTLLNRHPYRFVSVTVQPGQSVPEGIAPWIHQATGDQWCLKLNKQHEQLGDVLERFAADGLKILDVHTTEPGLEEVFLALTSATDADARQAGAR